MLSEDILDSIFVVAGKVSIDLGVLLTGADKEELTVCALFVCGAALGNLVY